MNLKDITLQATVLKVLADEVERRLVAVKETAKEAFLATGTDKATPELPDGTKVATASLCGAGAKGASVTGPAALLAWVQANHPGETETVVRKNYLEKLLETARKEGRAIDPVTGELVPGITVGDKNPYVSIRMRPGGEAAVVTAWRNRVPAVRDIELVDPLAIEDGAA